MVALGEHGSLREYHVRKSPLKHKRPPVRAVTDQVRFASHHKMEHRDIVAEAKEVRTGRELPLGRAEAMQSIEQGHEPDSYHVPAVRVQAQSTEMDLGACT